MLAGMNVARFNFSHGSHEEHKGRLVKVKELREELGLPVAALLDTKGPEIRLGDFKEGRVQLKKGQKFTLTARDLDGDETICSIRHRLHRQQRRQGVQSQGCKRSRCKAVHAVHERQGPFRHRVRCR